MNFTQSILTAAMTCSVILAGAAWSAEGPPLTPVRPVTTDYFGTRVVDNYRYMENLDDPEVQSWMRGQSAYARKVLDGIPGRDALARQIMSLMTSDVRRGEFQLRRQRFFYRLQDAGADLHKLAYRDGASGAEHVLVDPARLSSEGSHHFALDWYSPSWDGRYVAYGISEGGSEKSVLHIVDLQSGQQITESIDRTTDCIVSWRPDNQSFFYLRYPKPGPDTPASQSEYNAATFIHVIGQNPTGDGDAAVFGRGVSPNLVVPEGQGTYVLLSPDSKWAIAVANRNMDNTPNTFYVSPLDQVHGASTPWKKVADVEDGVTDVHAHGDTLYFLTEKNAPRFKLMATAMVQPDVEHAITVVPEGPSVIDTVTQASDGFFIGERTGSGFELRHVSYDGHDVKNIPLPFQGTVGDIATDPRETRALFTLRGWVKAPRELAYDSKTGAVDDTGLIPPSHTESSAFEAHEEFAVSYDGTRIPVSIISKKDAPHDGRRPTMVVGYGAYGISIDPFYDPAFQAWFLRGGIICIAHLRGGGEFGDAWHRAGQKLTKINTQLDLIAAAEYMIAQHYTQSKYLAANSASAGGIPMGGALTINPGLFRVVLDDVGISDTLRVETTPNGPPNVPEFGSTSTEEGFHALYSMSAYEHVHAGTAYPAVLFTTGANDPRVSPWQMMKMAARVQAATTSGRPVLLRIDYDAGHGIGSGIFQLASQRADEMAFTLWQMGEPEFQPHK